jgi:hypothetical protein
MSKERPPLPLGVADEVLYRNEHTCCICHAPRKHVQIHHIDGNPSNNKAANLAVVCLDCHSLVTSAHGFGRQYRPGEVRRYKKTWEQIVLFRRRAYKPTTRTVQQELIGQIDVIICQILATSHHKRRREMLEILLNLHLWRGTPQIDRQIIASFGHLAFMSGMDMPRLAKELAAKSWEMCWQFIGPHEVKMDASDVKLVAGCADVVETLAHFDCMMQQDLAVLKAALNTAENLFDVGLWYRREVIAAAVLKIYQGALEACQTGKQIEFPSGKRALANSAKAVLSKLRRSGLKWPKINRELHAITYRQTS